MPAASLFAALFATLSVATTAQAQPTAKAARPDPLDAGAAVPALRYESSFAQHRLLGDEKPLSWRDANDTVARIGGWRVYAREAQQTDPLPVTPTPTPTPSSSAPAKPTDTPPAVKPLPMPAGHAGHKSP